MSKQPIFRWQNLLFLHDFFHSPPTTSLRSLHHQDFEQLPRSPPGSNPEGVALNAEGANPPTPSFSAYFVLSVTPAVFLNTNKTFQKTPFCLIYFTNVRQVTGNSVLPLLSAASSLLQNKDLVMFCLM